MQVRGRKEKDVERTEEARKDIINKEMEDEKKKKKKKKKKEEEKKKAGGEERNTGPQIGVVGWRS